MKAPTVKQFLRSYPPAVRILAEKLRKIVQTTIPIHTEAVYPGWELIGYRIASGNKSKYFAFIAPGINGVKLGFEFGVLLPDPNHLLQGNGNQVRYIVITKQADIKKRLIAPLIWEAAMVAINHSFKQRKK